jgi:hypothetical protein
MLRTARPRDLVVLAGAVAAVALLWIPYYHDAFAGRPITPWAAWRDYGAGWWSGGILGLIVATGGLIGVAIRREQAQHTATPLRLLAAVTSGAATVAAIVHAVALRTRVLDGSACFGWTDDSRLGDSSQDGCSPFGVEWVPGPGYLLSLLLALIAATICLAGVVSPGRVAGWARLPARVVAPVALLGVLTVVGGSFTPVLRHYAWRDEGADLLTFPAVDWTAWHGYLAPLAVLVVGLGGLAAAGGPRAGGVAAPLAVVGLLATVLSGFAVPFDLSSFRVRRVGGVPTSLAMTWPGWGYFVLIGGAVVVLVAAVGAPKVSGNGGAGSGAGERRRWRGVRPRTASSDR